MDTSATSAVVVAGGRSTRFGDREKALAPIDGTPMLRRVADRVVPLVDEFVVNCRQDQREAFADALDGLAPRFAVDPVPDRGPVAGLRTGLRVAAGRRAVALACDRPFVEPGLFAHLLDRARVTDAAAVVPRADGRPQPLSAVYDVRAARGACTRVLDRGDRRLAAVLDELAVTTVAEATVVDLASPRALANVNTPAHLAGVDADRPESADGDAADTMF